MDATEPRTSQRGFSLLEAMISVAITSLAILGVAGLLLKGLNNAKTSHMRTLAALQASSLASAMYANRVYWSEKSISFSSIGDKPQVTQEIDLNTDATCTSDLPTAAHCPPATQGAVDTKKWIASVNNLLHAAKTSVACNDTPDSMGSCMIQIIWDEKYIDTSKVKSSTSTATAGQRSYILHVRP